MHAPPFLALRVEDSGALRSHIRGWPESLPPEIRLQTSLTTSAPSPVTILSNVWACMSTAALLPFSSSLPVPQAGHAHALATGTMAYM